MFGECSQGGYQGSQRLDPLGEGVRLYGRPGHQTKPNGNQAAFDPVITDWKSCRRAAMEKLIKLGFPHQIELIRHGSSMEIIRRWSGRWSGWLIAYSTVSIISITFFLIFLFNTFPFNMFYLTIIKSKSDWAYIFPPLFIVIFFIMLIRSIYSTLAGLFNRTHIVISREKFVSSH